MRTRQDGLRYYLEKIKDETNASVCLFTAASGFDDEDPIKDFIAQEPLESTGYERQPLTFTLINYDSLNSRMVTNLAEVAFTAGSTSQIQYDSIGVLIDAKLIANQEVDSISGTPAVFEIPSHGYVAGDPIIFTDATVPPSGLTLNQIYYVLGTDISTNTFKIAATVGGAALNIGSSFTGDLIVRDVGGTLIHWEPRPDDGLGNRTYTINSSQSHPVQVQTAMAVVS